MCILEKYNIRRKNLKVGKNFAMFNLTTQPTKIPCNNSNEVTNSPLKINSRLVYQTVSKKLQFLKWTVKKNKKPQQDKQNKFPSGNIELRRDAMGNAISVVQLWIICVISQNWRPDVRCGDVMTRMLKSTWCAAGASFQEWSIALVGMPEVWPCDAASRSLGEPGLHT